MVESKEAISNRDEVGAAPSCIGVARYCELAWTEFP